MDDDRGEFEEIQEFLATQRAASRPFFIVLTSATLHAAFAAVIALAAYQTATREHLASARAQQRAHSERPMEIDLPGIVDGTLVAPSLRETKPIEEALPSGARDEQLDGDRKGLGGDKTSRARATNLSDRNEAFSAATENPNHLDRDQMQRLRVSLERRSWEDRRSTRRPMELTFVLSGRGGLETRRPSGAHMPSLGAEEKLPRASLGAELGSPDPSEAGEQGGSRRGGVHLGSIRASAGEGARQAQPGDRRASGAPIAFARPSVAEGPVSVTASARGKPQDNRDSEQDVSDAVRSIVHASFAGGARGDGRGGSVGGGESGAGGVSGEGSRSMALGAGDANVFDLYTGDPRLSPYFRKIHAKLQPFWADAFPRSALAELKQGTVILEFTISEDGHASVSWPPVRPSGVAEFDRNCADAIRRAGPFGPIPKELGRRSLRVRAPFVASNPIVK